MSDQTPEPIETADSDSVLGHAFTAPDHAAAKAQIDNILTLDSILSSASRAERTVPICTNGTLDAEYNRVIAELGQLVDEEGNVVNGDGEASVADGARAEELQQQASALLAKVREATIPFRFRALPSDEFDEFDDSHRTGSDKHLKDVRKYEDELIAKCAISPVMDVAGVGKLRKQFSSAQVTALFNGAFFVNKADGIDVPKSPSYLHAPRPQE